MPSITGTSSDSPVAFGAAGSHPVHSRENPSRSGNALPRSSAVFGWLPAAPAQRLANSMMRPRLFTSYSSRPLPLAASAGRSSTKSRRYSTSPSAFRGARSSSAMPRLRGCAGSKRAARYAVNPLIRADVAERRPADEWRTALDFNPDDHDQCNSASLRSCNSSRVMPGTMSRTTNPPA